MLNKCPICNRNFRNISEGWREIIGCPECGLTRKDAERMIAAKPDLPKPISKSQQQLTMRKKVPQRLYTVSYL